jgi:2-oxoacid:acceptor oxidoreductase delta subunit (pyruvate/2-ketoisovalerate family)
MIGPESSAPFAITLPVGSSLANKTGSWRVERPVYVTLVPPCSDACPADEPVREWLYEAEDGHYEQAWRRLVEANPFPAIMGRVCYHPCETACNRGRLDEAVGINAVERFLGDEALEHGWALPEPADATGKRVLVVGAGPAGLSAAYHLRRRGHEVTIFEAHDEPGGMMAYGIPAYRLPRDVMAAEVDRVLAMGVHLELGHRVDDLAEVLDAGAFDATFVGVGAELARRTEIPAGDSARVLSALSLLASANTGSSPVLGRRVAVYGGGDTAMDAARTLRRLGVTDPVVVYWRSPALIEASPEELDEALEEGVRIRWLQAVSGFEPGTLRLERMEVDDDGVPHPTGQFEQLDADALVLAIGEESDLSLLAHLPDVTITDGSIAVDQTQMTGHNGVFAGGDAVAGQHTVTTALGHGARAAAAIDAWLANRQPTVSEPGRLAGYEGLNTWYYADAPRQERRCLEGARRWTSFDEVVLGLDERTALFEARRCLSCGSCFECDNCYGVCPDNAVRKRPTKPFYEFDYDYCKGCGICSQECPCGAIEMIDERI